jgi:hypothetical protein
MTVRLQITNCLQVALVVVVAVVVSIATAFIYKACKQYHNNCGWQPVTWCLTTCQVLLLQLII